KYFTAGRLEAKQLPFLAERVDDLGMHRRRGGRAPFVQIIDQLTRIGVLPQLLPRGRVEAPDGFLRIVALAIVAHREEPPTGDGDAAIADADLRLPELFGRIGPFGVPARFVGD